MRLDVESLRTFREVVTTGSFTAAAESLHLTQSAVSWKVKRLEQKVGHPLLVRSTKSLQPTDFGFELLAHAERLIGAHDEAVEALTRSELEGTVRIGSNDEVTATDVAAVIGRFGARHPRVRLRTRIGISTEIAELLNRSRLDVGLFQTFHPEPHDIVVWTETLSWVIGTGATVDAHESLPLLTFGDRCIYKPLMTAALEAIGRDYYVAFEAEATPPVEAAVRSGLGVAVLSEHHLGNGIERWQPIAPVAPLPNVSFVLRVNNQNRSAAVRALVDDLIVTLAPAGFSP